MTQQEKSGKREVSSRARSLHASIKPADYIFPSHFFKLAARKGKAQKRKKER